MSRDLYIFIEERTTFLYSLLDLSLYDLIFLGAAILVMLRPTAEDVLTLVGGRAVETRVPLAEGVHIPRAVLTAED